VIQKHKASTLELNKKRSSVLLALVHDFDLTNYHLLHHAPN